MNTQLIVLSPPGNPTGVRAGLRAVARLRRQLNTEGLGYVWECYRLMDETQAIVFLGSEPSAAATIDSGPDRGRGSELIERALAAATDAGWQVSQRLEMSEIVNMSWPGAVGESSLCRLSPGAAKGRKIAHARAILAALGAPGTLRIEGWHGSAPDGSTRQCHVLAFDGEDGVWSFLDSPACREWSATAADSPAWGINLPRLAQPGRGTPASLPAPPADGFSIRMTSPGEGALRLELRGRLEGARVDRCEQLCNLALRRGCRSLEVDIRGLEFLSRDGMLHLTAAAREIKQRGGRFVLIDRVDRARAMARREHLSASLPSEPPLFVGPSSA